MVYAGIDKKKNSFRIFFLLRMMVDAISEMKILSTQESTFFLQKQWCREMDDKRMITVLLVVLALSLTTPLDVTAIHQRSTNQHTRDVTLNFDRSSQFNQIYLIFMFKVASCNLNAFFSNRKFHSLELLI